VWARVLSGDSHAFSLIWDRHRLRVARNAARSQRRYRELLSRLPAPGVIPDPAESVAGRDTPHTRALHDALVNARPVEQHLLMLTALPSRIR
jgi:hypothetical protein